MGVLDFSDLAGKLEQQLGAGLRAISEAQSPEDQARLRQDCTTHTAESWHLLCRAKVAGAGLLSGLVGGPLGLGLEAVDLAYLLQVSARASLGIGHIFARNLSLDPGELRPVEVDYEHDLALIVAIWSGAVEATRAVSVREGHGAPGAAPDAAAAGEAEALFTTAGRKVLARLILKGSNKVAQKILGKVITKLLAKLAAKLGTRWIPVVGGLTSAVVNVWVLDGLVDAARRFYASDTLLLHDAELARAVAAAEDT